MNRETFILIPVPVYHSSSLKVALGKKERVCQHAILNTWWVFRGEWFVCPGTDSWETKTGSLVEG